MKNGTDTEKKTSLLADALEGMGTKTEDVKLPKIDTGGPAFPQYALIKGQMTGMTLHDYFATHASEADIKPYIDVQYTRSEARYKHADAMIETRRG